ncbi:Tumor protein D52 [Heterocephalus glaber]|uniref:Tumor protein D52 n=1 Tax=Heterocephalus glaber TaxID=10181 RepID=G5BP40_HETGA|nr:Tumor protein D52 [Heterocephalus glaber]
MVHPLPHIQEAQAPHAYNSQTEAQLLRAGGGDSPASILGLGVFGLTVVSAGVNKNYLYLSPSGHSSPPGSPTEKLGLLRTDPVPEEGEDAAATLSTTKTLSEEEQDELRRELAKVEEEIQTLSQVLAAKEKHLAEIKRKLGIGSLQELKQNIAEGWQDVTATSAYRETSETLSQAGQKTSAAFSSVGSVITKKLEDVKKTSSHLKKRSKT